MKNADSARNQHKLDYQSHSSQPLSQEQRKNKESIEIEFTDVETAVKEVRETRLSDETSSEGKNGKKVRFESITQFAANQQLMIIKGTPKDLNHTSFDNTLALNSFQENILKSNKGYLGNIINKELQN